MLLIALLTLSIITMIPFLILFRMYSSEIMMLWFVYKIYSNPYAEQFSFLILYGIRWISSGKEYSYFEILVCGLCLDILLEGICSQTVDVPQVDFLIRMLCDVKSFIPVLLLSMNRLQYISFWILRYWVHSLN